MGNKPSGYRLASVLVVAALTAACAGAGTGKEASVAPLARHDVDADPLALLPAGAIVVANIDARALFASPSLGPAAAKLAGALVPVGDDAGFVASRDVDRAFVASYAAGQPVVAAVLTGRFDVNRLGLAARTPGGAAIVRSTYGAYLTGAVGDAMFTPITPKTLVAGTPSGVHAVLDRLRDQLQRDQWDRAIPPQTVATLESPGAQAAAVVDLTSQPIAIASLGAIPLGWLRGVRVVRVIGDFNAPGLNVAATSTFDDPQAAQGAAAGIHALEGWLKVLAPVLGGARVENLQVGAAGGDVTCKFAVNGGSLEALAALGSRYLPAP